MNKRILVLGATGKTGKRLVKRLNRDGATVRAASRTPTTNGGVRFQWSDPATYSAALHEISAVYLLPPEMVEDASEMLVRFLDSASRAGVAHVTFLSSLGVSFPDEPSDSGRHKHEMAVQNSGLSWTILRPSGFFQNFSEGFFLPAILESDAIVTAAGDGAVAMIDADDIAAVAAATLTDPRHKGVIYTLTGPKALRFADAARVLSAVTRRPISYTPIEPEKMRSFLLKQGVAQDYASMLLRDLMVIRNGGGGAVSDTVRQITGRKAKTFEEYANETADFWRIHG
ncbi:MAG TPA: NAD(P)H-binding protein [Candidatus Acidoferrales bacterium]|nr:NAD(P)H-binding protein [Candidatus Acidoferrales bacterium]